jgi:hypothetical protein
MVHGLVIHEPHHIWPILRVRYRSAGLNPTPIAFAGTGFAIEGGYFVTCWHCVAAPLDEDEAYVALVKSARPTDLPAGLMRLHDLAQDANGSDLALARVTSNVTPGLVLARTQARQGESVSTWGYPLIPPPEARPEDGQLVFELNARFLKGYVTQIFNFSMPDGRTIPTIEIDMPAPAGLSGGATDPRGNGGSPRCRVRGERGRDNRQLSDSGHRDGSADDRSPKGRQLRRGALDRDVVGGGGRRYR